MAGAVDWGRIVFVGPTGAEIGSCVLRGPGAPDLSVVDALAGLQVALGRLGGSIRLDDVSPELAELLDLAGLRREVGGQPEGGEKVGGVEEGVELGDPPV